VIVYIEFINSMFFKVANLQQKIPPKLSKIANKTYNQLKLLTF